MAYQFLQSQKQNPFRSLTSLLFKKKMKTSSLTMGLKQRFKVFQSVVLLPEVAKVF
jgi:lipoprotein NlpI